VSRDASTNRGRTSSANTSRVTNSFSNELRSTGSNDAQCFGARNGSRLVRRIGAVAPGLRHVVERSEVDRGEVGEIVRVGKLFDVRVPTNGGHRNPKVIERGATADDRFPA